MQNLLMLYTLMAVFSVRRLLNARKWLIYFQTLGYPWPLGHADFFPNGGVPLQPGCAAQEIAKNRWLGVICETLME